MKCNYCYNGESNAEGFCNKCGARLKADDKTPLAPNYPKANAGQPYQQPYPYQQQPYQQPPPGYPYLNPYPQPIRKDKHITFLFVTSLVFMIIFAIRTLSSLISLVTWNNIRNSYPGSGIMGNLYASVIFSLFMTILTFAALPVMFIYANKAKKMSYCADTRKKASKILFISAIIILIFAIAYTVSEILILLFLIEFSAGVAEIGNPGSILGSIFFDAVFLAFCTVNLIKSLLFARDMKKLTETPA